MNKRSTARLGLAATATVLTALGSAMVIPAVASASPTTAVEVSTSAAPRPTMWVDCTQLPWRERIMDSNC